MKKIGGRLFDILSCLISIGFTLLVTWYFAPLGVDPHHDGILMKPAIDILHGKMLFRDTFTQYGALTTLMQAAAMKYFGEYLYVIRYLTAAFYAAIAFFLWIFWRRYMSSLLTTLSIIIWVGLFGFYGHLTLHPWSAVYALLCQTIALYFLVLWTKNKNVLLLSSIGVLSALAFWFRQPVGIYMISAVILFWILARVKKIKLPSLLPLLFGFIFVHLIFFYWLISNNVLTDWWLESISFAKSWEAAVATQYRFPFFQMSQLLPLSQSAISIWVLFPAVVMYEGYKIIKKKRLTQKEIELLATVSMCLFSWLQYYPMGDPTHTLWAATPMIGYFIYFAWNTPYKGKKKLLIFFLLLILLVPDVFNRMRDAKKKVNQTYFTFTDESILKGMKETKVNYEYFNTLLNAIKQYEEKHPETFVITLNQDALYPLFGKNTVNCSRFTVDWRWGIFDKTIEREYFSSTNTCIKKYKPLIITDKDHVNPTGYMPLTRQPNPPCSSPNDFISYLLAPKQL